MAYPFIDLKTQYERLEPALRRAIDKVLASGQFIGGPAVSDLEKALAAYTGSKFAIGCGNGTSSMELALLALGVGPGDAVFCPAFTFMATAEVAALRGAEPVFVDIDPVTYNIDPVDLAARLAAVKKEGRLKPRAIIPVDLFGLPANYPALEKLAADEGLFILEDAAQGFGGAIGRRRAGSFGLVASTSFFPAKPLGCYGDGGALFTDDEALAEALRSLRTHGSGAEKYEHVRLGVNSRLDALQAAILSVKLEAFPEELRERQRVAARYTANLAGQLTVPRVPEGWLSSWAQYTVRVDSSIRPRLIDSLKNKGVPTMVYYPKPLSLQPAFAYLGGRPGDLPVSEQACAEVLSLPMHPYLKDEQIDEICQLTLDCLKAL